MTRFRLTRRNVLPIFTGNLGVSGALGYTVAAPPPSAPSTGRLFVRSVGYKESTATGHPPDWSLTARNDVDLYPNVTGSPFTSASAEHNAPWTGLRNWGAGFRPADNRIWTGVGNYYSWPDQPPWDGFRQYIHSSGNPYISCFHIDNPKKNRRAFGALLDSQINAMYAGGSINPWKGHYEGEDKFLIIPGSPFGNEFDESHSLPPISPVTYVNATTVEFAATPAQVPLNQKMRFRINHPSGGNKVYLRARATAVTDIGGGRVRVTLSFWDTHATFQNPIEVTLVSGSFPAHWSPVGAWQVGNNNTWHYKESTNKWYTFLIAFDYTTYTQSEMLLEMPSALVTAYLAGTLTDDQKGLGAGALMSPTQTGRGWEFWGLTNLQGLNIARYDLTGRKYDVWPNTLADWGNAPVAYINFPCADQFGNLYVLQVADDSGRPYMTASKMLVYDIRGPSPTGVRKNMTHLIVPQDTGNNLGFCANLQWNPDLNMIEAYIGTNVTLGVGLFNLWLIDPSQEPMPCYKVGGVDSNGDPCWTSVPLPVKLAGENQKTWLMGGAGEESPPQYPDRLRWFIGGNLDWQALTLDTSQFYWRPCANFPNAQTTDAAPMALATTVPALLYGKPIMKCAANGTPLGELQYRLGGDGASPDNAIYRVMLNEIGSGTSVPVVCNAGRNSTDANLWRNKIHMVSGPAGGTAYQQNIIINKAQYDAAGSLTAAVEWQKGAGHHYNSRCYHPTHGYIECSLSPSIGATKEANAYPHAGMADQFSLGLESYTINDFSSQLTRAVNGWTPAGGWRRLAAVPASYNGESTAGMGSCPMAYNGSTGNVVWFLAGGANDRINIVEWNGTIGSTPTSKFVSGTPIPIGSGGGAWWLENDLFLLQSLAVNPADKRLALVNNSASPSWTLLTGINGNTILDASWAAGFDPIVAVDYQRRHVYWFVPPPGAPLTGPSAPLYDIGTRSSFRLYRSSFDSLMNLTPVPVKSRATLDKFFVLHNHVQSDNHWAYVYDGFIYVLDQTGGPVPGHGTSNHMKVWRLPII